MNHQIKKNNTLFPKLTERYIYVLFITLWSPKVANILDLKCDIIIYYNTKLLIKDLFVENLKITILGSKYKIL